IDDLLFDHGISHEKEPRYPGADYRADWKILAGGTEVFIELFGLDGEPNYTKRKREKLAYAEQAGMRIVALERKDLVNLKHAFHEKMLVLSTDMGLRAGPKQQLAGDGGTAAFFGSVTRSAVGGGPPPAAEAWAFGASFTGVERRSLVTVGIGKIA